MLQLKNVSYSYGKNVALHDVSLSVEQGEIVCLLGPSGCGKTTLLRVIAGVESSYTGDVLLDREDMRNVAVHQRDFGLMFQDFALFPHMSVEKNIAYGLKRRGFANKDIKQRVAEMLDKVELNNFADRDINSLSGGQKQRVALARSLAPNPQLLMLDEPLGSLDAQLRDELIVELRDIIKSVGLTAIYVTHDQKEAYAIANRIAIMNLGEIVQIDTPQNLYYRPRTRFVARFLGLSNIFLRETLEQANIPIDFSRFSSLDPLYFLIHPAGIHVSPTETVDFIEIKGLVEQVLFRGDYSQLTLRVTDLLILNLTVKQNDIEIGNQLSVFVEPDCILPLE